jgi:deoxyribodipyrimidine photo-lyase
MREVPRDGRFVMQRMRALGTLPCMDRADAMVAALARARTLHGRFDPHLGPAFEPLGLAPVPEAFDGPQERCRSFSTWWSRTRLRDEAGGGPLAPAESQAESA